MKELGTLNNINEVVTRATSIGNMIVGLAIAFAVVWIIITVVQYLVMAKDSETARKEGGMRILYGILGLFVILSIWGLVAILRNSFKTSDEAPTPAIKNIADGVCKSCAIS